MPTTTPSILVSGHSRDGQTSVTPNIYRSYPNHPSNIVSHRWVNMPYLNQMVVSYRSQRMIPCLPIAMWLVDWFHPVRRRGRPRNLHRTFRVHIETTVDTVEYSVRNLVWDVSYWWEIKGVIVVFLSPLMTCCCHIVVGKIHLHRNSLID